MKRESDGENTLDNMVREAPLIRRHLSRDVKEMKEQDLKASAENSQRREHRSYKD